MQTARPYRTQSCGRISDSQSELSRAIRYCLIKAEDSLHAIAGSESDRHNNLAEKRLGRLRSEMDYIDMAEILSGGLHEFFDGFQFKLNRTDDAIYETFFALRPVEGVMAKEGPQ